MSRLQAYQQREIDAGDEVARGIAGGLLGYEGSVLDALVVAERRIVLEEGDAEARLMHAVCVRPCVHEEWPRAGIAMHLERVGHREHVEADVDGHWHVLP